MKVTSMTWGSDVSLLVEGGKALVIELDAWSARDLEDERKRKDCINSFEYADVILLRLTTDKVWDEFIEELNKNVPIIPLGRNTFFRSLSNVLMLEQKKSGGGIAKGYPTWKLAGVLQGY